MAEEAALLLELLASRGWTGGSGPAADTGSSGSTGSTRPTAREGACTCGGQRPAACGICPVCQLISFVQGISPETIERVAEVVDLAATALRDLATTQRERQTRGGQDDS